jgi:hypothetical protein
VENKLERGGSPRRMPEKSPAVAGWMDGILKNIGISIHYVNMMSSAEV